MAAALFGGWARRDGWRSAVVRAARFGCRDRV